MSIDRKIKRQQEKKRLKEENKKMLKDLGVSNRYFKKTLPNLVGSGYEYKKSEHGGHKPSLRQRYSFLQDMKSTQQEIIGDIDIQKQKIKEGQALSHPIKEEEEDKELLLGNIKSFFNKE